MRMSVGLASGLARRSDVDLWMATMGAPGAAALLDFVGNKYGFRSPTGAPRWGSVAADLTFARASTASYLDAAGHVQFAASGEPRFTHDAGTGAALGLLTEQARTNMLVNPVWSGAATPTSWAAYSPEGVSIVASKYGSNVSARRFTAEASRPRLYQSVSLTAGVTYTVSIELERLEGSIWASHALFCGTAGVTLTYPMCPANPAGGASSALTSGRLVMQAVSATTQAAYFQLGAGAQHNLSGVTADISMPQVEAGTWPTSFIPGGTRAADRLSLTLPFDAHDAGVTIAAKGRMPRWPNPSSSNLFVFGPSTLFPRIGCYSFTAGVASIFSTGSPAPFAPPVAAGGLPAGQPVRAVISAAPDGTYRACINGAAVTTRAGNALPAGSNFLDIGNLAAHYAWGDAVESIAIWRGTPHSDATLQGLLS